MTLDMRRVDSSVTYYRQLGTRVPATLARALNTGIQTGRSAAQQLIVQKVTIKEQLIHRAFHSVPATEARLEARLQARPVRVPLIAYLDIRGGLRSGQGVGGRAYGLGTVPGRGFLAKMPSGHRGVYARTGKARLPIRELMGPSVADLIARERIFDKIMPAVNAAVRLTALKVAA